MRRRAGKPSHVASLVVAIWIGGTEAMRACPVCFRLDDGPTAAGVRVAVAVLMAVTLTVLTFAGRFVVRFARRSQAEPAERPTP